MYMRFNDMSGGYVDYKQFIIRDIEDILDGIIKDVTKEYLK
jgi:hypothetical protein